MSSQLKNLTVKFAFAYLALFGLRFFFAFLEANQIMPDPYPVIWAPAVRLLGENVWHVHGVKPLITGGYDTLFDYIEIVCLLIWAAAVALAWEPLARGNKASEMALPDWTRVLMRFILISAMLFYGLDKVFCKPTAELSHFALLQPLGGQTAAKAYSIFTGVFEIIVGALLLSETTTMLGALLCLAILTNVFMLDLSYGVGAKIDCAHFLVISAMLLAPDARRLFNFFTNRPIDPLSSRTLALNGNTKRRAAVAQLAVGLVIFAAAAIVECRYSMRNHQNSSAPGVGKAQ